MVYKLKEISKIFMDGHAQHGEMESSFKKDKEPQRENKNPEGWHETNKTGHVSFSTSRASFTALNLDFEESRSLDVFPGW